MTNAASAVRTAVAEASSRWSPLIRARPAGAPGLPAGAPDGLPAVVVGAVVAGATLPSMPVIQPMMVSTRPLRSTFACGHDGPWLTTETSTAASSPCWVKYGPPESCEHGLVVARGALPVMPTYPRDSEVILNWPVWRWVTTLDGSSSTVRP